jgi:hypothetical protein
LTRELLSSAKRYAGNLGEFAAAPPTGPISFEDHRPYTVEHRVGKKPSAFFSLNNLAITTFYTPSTQNPQKSFKSDSTRTEFFFEGFASWPGFTLCRRKYALIKKLHNK